jgi:hypothetical protein
MIQDLSKIRHVQPNDPVDAGVTSQPTRAIELRLQELEALVYGTGAANLNNQLILYNMPINTQSPNQVGLYNTVFYNPNTNQYELAIADVTLVAGTFTNNPSALAVGVVIAINGGMANILIGGANSWGVGGARTDMLNALIVEGASGYTPGVVYYLSATVPGKVTQYPPSLKIQVLVDSNNNFIVAPIYATPDAIQNIYSLPVGMRPVGSVRTIPPDQDQSIVVGFDALEQYDSVNNLWRLSSEGTVAAISNFGYMVADARVTTEPANPIYVRIQVDGSGHLNIFSANKLADLYDGGPNVFNQFKGVSALLALSSGNQGTVRYYTVVDNTNVTLGTLAFKFTSADISLVRHVIFKFPDHFQGWKMVNAPIPPTAAAVINSSGVITNINVTEGSVGYTTPPTVVIVDGSGPGFGATATAVLNEFGMITSITVNNGGSGYIAPVVSFDSRLTNVQVLNGGSGATATATVIGGSITSVTVTNGGSGYYANPTVSIVDPLGVGLGAQLATEVLNGAVISVAVINGGSGYNTSPLPILKLNNPFNSNYDPGINYAAPLLKLVGQTPTTNPVLAPSFSAAGIVRVDVLSSGIGYSPLTTITITPNLNGAVVHPVVDSDGRIIRVDVLNAGSNFSATPTLTIVNYSGFNGNGASLQAVLGSSLQSVVISNAGKGLTDPAAVLLGTPVRAIEIEASGSGYVSAPAVTIDPPDTAGIPVASGGVQATAVALMGGTIARVEITNAGTGYSQTSPPAITLTGTGGTGAALSLSVGADGTIWAVEVLNPGSGYTALSATIAAPISGTTATVNIYLEGAGSVIGFTITNPGNGYVGLPNVVIAASPTLDNALASSKLVGGTAQFQVTMSGAGGTRIPQTLTLSQGNNLQIWDYNDDFPDIVRPLNACWYYNMNADPNLKALYPAVPIDKVSFLLNGVEQNVTTFNESTQLLSNPDADFAVSRRTLLWTTFDTDGCPWDASVQQYANDTGALGRDCQIPLTGPVGLNIIFWNLWDQMFKYEPQRNQAWIDLNKASRFYQTGRVESLAALSPLVLIDTVTGNLSSNDGTPMTGQLLITLDSAANLTGKPSVQINLTNPGEIQPIYTNNTGRLVAISSIVLVIVFQNNSAGSGVPDASYCANITIGTQAGNYRDIVGSSTADVYPTRLFAVNQVKEVFPDPDQPAPLIQPHQSVYIQVVQPAGSPITTQLAVARIKGAVL